MKKPSDTKPSHSPPELTFFTDRDLGKIVPRILRENGLTVERYCDHFQEKNVSDVEWITYAARNRWIGISHDNNIRRDPITVNAIMKESGRLFIVRGVLTGREKAQLVLGALKSISHIVAKHQDEAFIAVVKRETTTGGVVHAEAQVRLTGKQWTPRMPFGTVLRDDEEELLP